MPTVLVKRAKKAERDIAASAARSVTVHGCAGRACIARNAATSRSSDMPRARLGMAVGPEPQRNASIRRTSSKRSSTNSRPGLALRVSSPTSSINVASRGSPRATTIAGSSDTSRAASGDAKLQMPTCMRKLTG